MKETKGIALSYTENDRAPKVIAKGKGIILKKMLEIAKKNNLPVYRDNDLTEALFALDIGREIPYELYAAVAEIIAYCWKLNGRLKQVL